MTAGCRLREATPLDAEGIARVHIETWRATYPGLLPDRYLAQFSLRARSKSWRESIGRKSAGTVLVLEAPQREIVGFGSCGPSRVPQPPFQGEVYTLYLTPDWQNQGLGRRLLGGLFEELAAAGMTSAFLWVLAANPTRFFYERMGGQPVGQRMENFAGAKHEETAYGWPDLVAWIKAAQAR
ncbi:MAG: GNAT family N-acetyltransferase [Rhodovibrionaceae bacterium]